MALISWHNKLEPPLPSHNSPAVQGGLGSFENKSHSEMFQGANSGAANPIAHPDDLDNRKAYAYEPKAVNQPGVIPPGVPNDTHDINRSDILTGPSTTRSVTRPIGENENGGNAIDEATQGLQQTSLAGETPEHRQFEETELGTRERFSENAKGAATTGDIEHIVHTKRGETDSANSSNGPNGAYQATGPGTTVHTHAHGVNGPDAKTQEFLSHGDQALPTAQIQQPLKADSLLPEHITDDPHYDSDIAGEVARVQTAVSPKAGETRGEAVTRHLNHTKNEGFKGNAPECEPGEEMTPYIPHPVHEPFPIAMVCREPYGTPTHSSVYNPQNEVWLSALRNAKKNVFIQSPTLNAEPLVPAIIDACERGIDVYCYICLGYNDTVSPWSSINSGL